MTRFAVRSFRPGSCRIPSAAGRRGITLVELIVVTSIAALMAAIVLPAVLNAREVSRFATCRDRLRNLATATMTYNDTNGMLVPSYLALHNDTRNGKYPEGGLADYYGACSGTPNEDANFHIWGEMLLPYLEQAPLYSRIDQKQPVFAPIDMSIIGLPNYTADNQSAAATPVEAFLCPAAPRTENPFQEKTEFLDGDCEATRKLQGVYMAGANDYTTIAGYLGRLNHYYQAVVPPARRNLFRHGALFIGPSWVGERSTSYLPRLQNITDGQATTILFAERAAAPDLWQLGVKANMPEEMIHATTGEYNYNSGGCWACPDNGEYWIRGSTFDGKSYPSVPGSPVCVINCTNEVEFGIYSFHDRVCNVVMVDGSVRGLSEQMGVEVICNLITPRGHARVPANLFDN